MTKVSGVSYVWKGIDEWLLKHAAPLLANLRPPASEDDVAALKKHVPTCPSMLLESLKIHDGCLCSERTVLPDIGRVLSAKDIASWVVKVTDTPKLITSPSVTRFTDSFQIRPFITWPKGWLPFAQFSKNVYFAIDLVPVQDEDLGQIIYVEISADFRIRSATPFAGSLADFLEVQLNYLEKNRYWFDSKNNRLRKLTDRPSARRKKPRLP